MIPVKYNYRNLRVRWVSTSMTVIATALVVLVTVLVFGLLDGLKYALRVSGDPLDIIVFRPGSDNEISSNLTPQQGREINALPGIARNDKNEPMCSAEFVTILTKPRRNNGGTTNLIVRGLETVGRELRPGYKIVEGRDVEPGKNEVVTSRSMSKRFENLGLNEELMINKSPFKVVGIFEAGGSAAESEVWADFRDLTSAVRIPDTVSTVNLRATDPESMEALMKSIKEDKQFLLKPMSESEYYSSQASAAIAFQIFAYFLGALLTFGAMFAAANTMYAAVASRAREIGTLRAIGFSQMSILTSFLLESVILCMLGGLVGCLLALPFQGYSTGTANWASFSEFTFSFRFGPMVMAWGVGMALVMGLLGGLFPALSAVRMKIVEALRKA